MLKIGQFPKLLGEPNDTNAFDDPNEEQLVQSDDEEIQQANDLNFESNMLYNVKQEIILTQQQKHTQNAKEPVQKYPLLNQFIKREKAKQGIQSMEEGGSKSTQFQTNNSLSSNNTSAYNFNMETRISNNQVPVYYSNGVEAQPEVINDEMIKPQPVNFDEWLLRKTFIKPNLIIAQQNQAQGIQVSKKYHNTMFKYGGTLRLNPDLVEIQRIYCEQTQVLDKDDISDDNEDKITFFDKTMEQIEDEVGDNCGSTKQYTSLKYFKIQKNKQRAFKRDAVEACFERDLEIFRITKNFKKCTRWMIAKGMIPEKRKCPCCDNLMRIVNCHTKIKDGLIFKCARLECREIKISIREGTIFDNNHLTLMEILRVIFYYFARGFNALQTYKDLKEYNVPTLQYQYVYDVYRKIRYLIHLYLQNSYKRNQLGQFGRIVEIDESKFTHHTKGGVRSKVWVLGFYERITKDVRAFVLTDRSEYSCTNMIRDNVMEGATVCTDSWNGYSELRTIFDHKIANKANDQQNGINRVECLWHLLKRNIHTYSTVRSLTLQRFLDEACWRIKYRTFTERNQFLMQLLNVTRN